MNIDSDPAGRHGEDVWRPGDGYCPPATRRPAAAGPRQLLWHSTHPLRSSQAGRSPNFSLEPNAARLRSQRPLNMALGSRTPIEQRGGTDMKLVKVLTGTLWGLVFALMTLPGLAADYPAPKEGSWGVRDFRFHTGEVLAELRLHYTTVGAPTGEPVLMLHRTTMSGAGM